MKPINAKYQQEYVGKFMRLSIFCCAAYLILFHSLEKSLTKKKSFIIDDDKLLYFNCYIDRHYVKIGIEGVVNCNKQSGKVMNYYQ